MKTQMAKVLVRFTMLVGTFSFLQSTAQANDTCNDAFRPTMKSSLSGSASSTDESNTESTIKPVKDSGDLDNLSSPSPFDFTVRFQRDVPPSIHKRIEELIDQSQEIFENATDFRAAKETIAGVFLEVDGVKVQVSLIQDPNHERGFSVKLQAKHPPLPTQNVRFTRDSLAGGLGREVYIKERDLKEGVASYPRLGNGKLFAVQLTDQSSKRLLFALYKDHDEKKKKETITIREIKDVAYPRSYRIPKSVRTLVNSRHGVTLKILDEVFEGWDGKGYKDLYLDKFGNAQPGVARYRERHSPEKGEFYWFLYRTEEDKLLRVVIRLDDGYALPTIVTAYFPHEAGLEALNETMQTSIPIQIFEDIDQR